MNPRSQDKATERAEKIALQMVCLIQTSKFSLGAGSHAPDVDFHRTFSSWIAASIREAVEEALTTSLLSSPDYELTIERKAFSDGIKEGDKCTAASIAKAYGEGYAKAVDDCAKVAETWPGVGGIVDCKSMDTADVMNGLREGIVKRIRAMRQEGGGGVSCPIEGRI